MIAAYDCNGQGLVTAAGEGYTSVLEPVPAIIPHRWPMQSLDANLLGIGVLSLLGLALVARVVIALRRMPFTPFQSILFGINYLLVRVLWRAEVRGSLSIPPTQGAVIVCNHRAPIDPFFLYLATRRLIHWMVAKEFVDNPGMSWFFRRVGTISVNRGGIDTAATKMAIRCTQEGGLVGLFPEGRINTTDRTAPARTPRSGVDRAEDSRSRSFRAT